MKQIDATCPKSQLVISLFPPDTPQKSNELIPTIAMFKGSRYLFQPIILGIQPLVFGGVMLGGGFKYLLFSSLLGEMIQFD